MYKYFFALMLISFSPIVSAQDSLDELIHFMEEAIEFEKNNYEILSRSEDFAEMRLNQAQETFRHFIIDIYDITRLIGKIRRYKNQELSPNALLQSVFSLRMDQSRIAIHDYLKNMRTGTCDEERKTNESYWAIDEEAVEGLREGVTPMAQWNHIISRTSLDRFQLMGTIIKEILLKMKKRGESLTAKNMLWFKCSTTLHPYLAGQVEILERPERAAGINLQQYDSGFATAAVDRTYKSEINLIKHYLDTCLEISVPEMSMGAKTYDLNATFYISQYERNQMSEKVYSPDGRIIKKINNPKLPKFDDPITLVALEKVDIENHEETKEGLADEVEDSHPNPTADTIDASLLSASPAYSIKKPPTPMVKKVEASSPPTRAQELKKFLKRNQINWLKGLFANSAKEYKYLDFSAIWKRLFGESSIVASKKGSSHFKLLGPSGSVVGGLFTHGRGQRYWGNAIQDLKNLFIATGIDSDLVDSL